MAQSILEKLQAGAMVFDIRNPDEFAQGHFPGATNVPLPEMNGRLAEFGPKDAAIVLYCHSGRRSGLALEILKNAGYTNLVNAGGLVDMPIV
jgi:phage shock protein E